MYYVLCTMYCVLCTVHSVLCTMYYVLCTMYYVLCTMYCVLCTMYYVLCTMYCDHNSTPNSNHSDVAIETLNRIGCHMYVIIKYPTVIFVPSANKNPVNNKK